MASTLTPAAVMLAWRVIGVDLPLSWTLRLMSLVAMLFLLVEGEVFRVGGEEMDRGVPPLPARAGR